MQSDTSFFAHSLADRPMSEWELLSDHSEAVATRAARFARAFGAEEPACLLGLLHDLGKAKPRFQAKLRGEINSEPHSAEGARFLQSHYGPLGSVLSACIAGHHSGLSDPDALEARLGGAAEMRVPDWMGDPAPLGPFGPLLTEKFFHYDVQFAVRMLFSCLVDADELETAAFYDAAERRPVDRAPDRITSAHRDAFDAHMSGFSGAAGMVNELRADILEAVRSKAAEASGLFTLTVPTGGGKTLASLGFALDHALAHGMERIIHVIPYTSIVEQNADVYSQILGPEAVVEHHSTFDWDGVDDDETLKRLARVTRNWDAPVIVTTAVQFFESLYAARKRRCAKLHNLANAVIVIDEAQTMPIHLLRPCLAAIKTLARSYGASVVLSTATQPAVTREAGLDVPEALENIRELAPDPPRLYRKLRRTRVQDAGRLDNAALVGRIEDADHVLTIVSKRRHARSLFDQIRHLPGAAHLSTAMTPQHRRHVLSRLRGELEAGAPVRLVATSLVEAGVDIDFPLVMRAAAGIDSIAQAAGRCNREGTLDGLGEVVVFTPTAEGAEPPEDVRHAAEIGAEVLAAFPDDPLSERAVAEYFRALLWSVGEGEALDAALVGEDRKRGILKEISETGSGSAFRYAFIADAFRMIDDAQAPVIIRGGRWGLSDDLLKDLEWREGTGGIAKALQPFVVNLPRGIRARLEASRAAHLWRPDLFGREFLLLDHETLYDPEAGLRMEGFEDLGLLNF